MPKDRQQSDALKPKQCPNCNEPNKPDSRFCAKCRMVLTYDAYNDALERQEEKESEIIRLRRDIKAMTEDLVPLELKKTLENQGLLKVTNDSDTNGR
jgi:hypothetical protein